MYASRGIQFTFPQKATILSESFWEKSSDFCLEGNIKGMRKTIYWTSW